MKYTFAEFVAADESDDFDRIEPENLKWANRFVKLMGESGNEVHFGDCTKHSQSCMLCVHQRLLEEYHLYYFDEENYRKEYLT